MNSSKFDFRLLHQASDLVALTGSRYAPVRYDCKQSPILLVETSTLMVQWSSDVNQQFSLSYVIGENTASLSGCTVVVVLSFVQKHAPGHKSTGFNNQMLRARNFAKIAAF